jgi:hypothetical protein
MTYGPAAEYAERQMSPAVDDPKITITRPAIRRLHTVEAEKPVRISGRPERVEPVAQPATSRAR